LEKKKRIKKNNGPPSKGTIKEKRENRGPKKDMYFGVKKSRKRKMSRNSKKGKKILLPKGLEGDGQSGAPTKTSP